jgi:hypothetical protein
MDKIVRVKWWDHNSQFGWHRPEEYRPLACETVGFLVFEDKKVIALALNKDESGSVAEVTTIIKREIIEREDIK